MEAHEKASVLARLPEFPTGDTLQAFYVLLAKNGRFALLPDIVVAYQQLERREQGEGLCVLRCARDPRDDTLGPLARFLCKQHGYQSPGCLIGVSCRSVEDPSDLIGVKKARPLIILLQQRDLIGFILL